MPAKVHTSKVLCYIVRDGQLLVFRHADYDLEHVGIQIPAGSIRHGESPRTQPCARRLRKPALASSASRASSERPSTTSLLIATRSSTGTCSTFKS